MVGSAPANRDEHVRPAPANRRFIGSSALLGLPSSVEGVALNFCRRKTRFRVFAQRGRCVVTRLLQPTEARQPRAVAHTLTTKGAAPTPPLRAMAPPPGQTNRDTSAADHTTCFYCHQQLILVSHKVIVSRDAHGCSIRICEPCEKEARRRRPGRLLRKRSRRRRTET